MPRLWDRMENEPASHFAMFIFYRDIGPTRTYEQVRSEFNRGRTFFAKIYTKWEWKSRALAYDSHLDSVRQGSAKLAVHNMAQRQATLGLKMQGLAERRLNEFTEKPELMATVSMGDAIKLASEGVRIERLAEGETTGEEGQPIVFNIAGGQLPKWAPKQAVVVSSDGNVPNQQLESGEESGDVDIRSNVGEIMET